MTRAIGSLLAIAGAVGLAILPNSGVHASSLAKTPGVDEAEILRIEQGMTGAQTPAQYLAAWDQDVTWYDLTPGEIDSLAAARESIVRQFAGVTNLRAKILRIKVVADDRIAFAYSTQNFVADGKDGKPNLDFVFRQTDGFEKRGGRWILLHQHVSFPIDFTTGRAVFDSK